jgi:hypothetical protein
MMEGVYSTDSSGKPIFYDVAGPTDEEVAQVLEAIAHVVTRMLRKKSERFNNPILTCQA